MRELSGSPAISRLTRAAQFPWWQTPFPPRQSNGMGDNEGFKYLHLPGAEMLLLSTDGRKICWLIYNLQSGRGMLVVVKFIDAMNYRELAQFHTHQEPKFRWSLSCCHLIWWWICTDVNCVKEALSNSVFCSFFYRFIASTNQCFTSPLTRWRRRPVWQLLWQNTVPWLGRNRDDSDSIAPDSDAVMTHCIAVNVMRRFVVKNVRNA